MNRFVRLTWLLVTGLLAGGCIGSTTYHTATPIPQDELEIGVMPGIYGITVDEGNETESIVLPMVGFGLRTGVAENMDFGVRVNGVTVTADLNIAVVNEPNFAFSIDPAATIFFFSIEDGSVL